MMRRREALKGVALILGGGLSAPTLMAMERAETPGLKVVDSDLALSDIEKKIVAEVAEMIIPRTTTPGAIDAGVPAFIEIMLRDCYKKPEHLSFKTGLLGLERLNFITRGQKEKESTLRKVEQDTVELMKEYNVQQTKMGDNEDREQMKAVAKGLPFWRLMKELTLLGYYTSEKGIMASFDYVPIPGKLELIKLKPGQKAFAY